MAAIEYDIKHQLSDQQSLAIFALNDRAAKVYYAKLDMAGNSILSTLLVESADVGATVKAQYYDITTGDDIGEANLLKEHGVLSSGLTTNKILIGNTHDKVFLKLTVSGGSARCSVYATIVSTSATELASALVAEGQTTNLIIDKAISVAAYDEDAGIWRFLRTDGDGRLVISGILSGKSAPTIHNLSMPLANTEYNYTFPNNTREFYLQNRTLGLVKFAYTIGSSGTLYKTLFPGGVLNEDNLELETLNIYIQSPSAGQTIEIVSWT